MEDLHEKPYIFDESPEALLAFCRSCGQPDYRARQLLDWLDSGQSRTDAMSNLPQKLREALDRHYRFELLECCERLVSAKDGTRKYAFRLNDGNLVEAVLMQYRYGASLCVSSQAGCRMGCDFCASARAGFGRNLSSGEMLAQLRLATADSAVRIGRVVVMGIGEPLENYEAVLQFFRELHEPRRWGISYRNMTLSTCGLVPEMIKFSNERLPVNLAVSLHAPDDALRQALMPIARRYPLEELLDACRYYTERSGRRISFEYALFRGVNDSVEQAGRLALLLKNLLCHVNLIPANPFPGGRYQGSDGPTARNFMACLEAAHIPCTIRRSLGRDILAACGQLRRTLET